MQKPASEDSAWKLGVDVGGTFTDAVLYNENTGEAYKAKVFLVDIFGSSYGLMNAWFSRLLAPLKTKAKVF